MSQARVLCGVGASAGVAPWVAQVVDGDGDRADA